MVGIDIVPCLLNWEGLAVFPTVQEIDKILIKFLSSSSQDEPLLILILLRSSSMQILTDLDQFID